MGILDVITRGLSVAVAVYVAAAIMDADVGFGYLGFPQTPFTYHPVMMTVAFVLFMTQGVVCYVSDYGEVLNSKFPDRPSRRMLHGAFQMCATFCGTVGYLIAFVVHESKGKSHIAKNESKLKQSHVWLGYITLGLAFAQAVLGFYKFVYKVKTGAMVYHWHGKIGPLIYLLGLLTISLGASILFCEKHMAICGTMNTMIGLLAVFVVIQIIAGPQRGMKAKQQEVESMNPYRQPLISGDKNM